MAKTKGKSSTVSKKTPAVSADPYDRLQQKVQARKGSNKYYKFGEGKHVLRIFGFTHDGETEYSVEDVSHYVKDANRFIPCGDNCVICEYREEQIDLVKKALQPSTKYLFNAVVRGQGSEEDQQVIVQLPISVVNGTKKDPDNCIMATAKQFNAFDQAKGRDYTIIRTGLDIDTRYKVTPDAKSTPIGMKVKPVDLIALQAKNRAPLDAGESEVVLKTLKKKYERT